MKKILIISYMFKPDNNPRAFRAYELARELGKKYDVTVLTKINDRDSNNQNDNFKILEIPSGFLFNKNQVVSNTKVSINRINNNGKVNAVFTRLYNYIFYSREIEFAFEVQRRLTKIQEHYDVVISIANPFSSHIGTWLFFRNKKQKPKIILDYGDPFFKNPCFNIAKYFKWIEQKIINFADYIVVPVQSAMSAFDIYRNSKHKIKIICQGVDIQNFSIPKYKENGTPCCMYAGTFYEDIRNPISFLEKIITLDLNFKFYINTNIKNLNKTKMGKRILELVEQAQDKIILSDIITRKECISKMATMDFLINFKNKYSIQSPSKLIDYGIAKRPVMTIMYNDEDIKIFKQFLNKDYHLSEYIELSDYDIRNVSRKFEELF